MSDRQSQEIPHIIWKQNVHYYVRKSLSLIPVLSYTDSVQSAPYFFKIHFMIFSHTYIFQQVSFLQDLQPNCPCILLPATLVLFVSITAIIFGEECKL
jgi:hypothetical protein